MTPSTRDKFYLFVNGIRTKTGDHTAWMRRAEVWVESNTPHRADSYDYHTWALTRWLTVGKHRDQLAECLGSHTKYHDVDAVGHSNGAHLLCEALKLYPDLRVRRLHLIAGAALADFNENGLNLAVKCGQVESIHVYTSKRDTVLAKYAKPSRRLLGWANLGYGSLGLDGPQYMSDAAKLITRVHPRDDFDHSTWFEAAHFNDTLRRVTGETEQ